MYFPLRQEVKKERERERKKSGKTVRGKNAHSIGSKKAAWGRQKMAWRCLEFTARAEMCFLIDKITTRAESKYSTFADLARLLTKNV
jgi:hypothetical protein